MLWCKSVTINQTQAQFTSISWTRWWCTNPITPTFCVWNGHFLIDSILEYNAKGLLSTKCMFWTEPAINVMLVLHFYNVNNKGKKTLYDNSSLMLETETWGKVRGNVWRASAGTNSQQNVSLRENGRSWRTCLWLYHAFAQQHQQVRRAGKESELKLH